MLGLSSMQAVPVPYLQMTLPSGFTDRWAAPMTFFESAGGQYLTNYDLTTLKPAIAKTYYCSRTGSSGAAGTSQGAPLDKLSTCLAKVDVDEVVIDCSDGVDWYARNSFGWNNTQPSRSLSVRVIGPGKFYSIQSGSTNAPTWVAVEGAIYKTTLALSGARSVIDLSITESDGFRQRLTSVGSQGAMTAGTYYNDGTDTFVWASDSRNLVGDLYMQPCGDTNNCRIPSASQTTYIDGLHFIGGAPLTYVSAGVVDPLVVALNCTFQGSSTNSKNNISITGPGRFYFYRCGSARAWRDAFNYHGDANGDPNALEWECYTSTTGSTAGSDNASTAHEDAAIIRLNGRYVGGFGRPVADINDTRTMILGGYIGQSQSAGVAGNEDLAQQNTNLTWLGGVSLQAGANPQLVIVNTATVAYRKMTAPTRAGTGEDTGTLTTW